jgi:FlaA1/EpsC-like NDP-sugar epimerase
MKKIILIGGGGHSKSCIDVIENENKYKIVGIVDKKKFFL